MSDLGISGASRPFADPPKFSTLVIQGLGMNTLQTSLLGIPQGALVVIWIGLGAIINERLPKNSRTIVCGLFMLPTIAGGFGFLLAPTNAYVGRLICFYLTGSYQASFVLSLSSSRRTPAGRPRRCWCRHDLVWSLYWQHRRTFRESGAWGDSHL